MPPLCFDRAEAVKIYTALDGQATCQEALAKERAADTISWEAILIEAATFFVGFEIGGHYK